MAIAFANLGVSANPDINSGTDLASYANSSWTPPSSELIIVFVHGARSGGPDVPTISGNGLTWTQIGTMLTFGTSRSLTLFGANASGSSEGVTTVDFAANVQTGCIATFFHVTGVDLSSGVAAAFVQMVTAVGNSTSGSVTLAAAGNANNRPISCFIHFTNEGKTPQTNWTELDELGGGGPARHLETQYRSDAFDTAAAASWTTSGTWGAMAAELKAAAGGGTTYNDSVTLSAVAVVAPANNLVAAESVGLSATATMTLNANAMLSEAMTLNVQAASSVLSNLIAQDAISLAATAVIAQGGGLLVLESISMAVAAAVQQAAAYTLSAALNLPVTATITTAPQLVVGNTISLGVTVSVAMVGEGGESEVPVLVVYSADVEIRFVADADVEMRFTASADSEI